MKHDNVDPQFCSACRAERDRIVALHVAMQDGVEFLVTTYGDGTMTLATRPANLRGNTWGLPCNLNKVPE
jgi:hypothetical protein